MTVLLHLVFALFLPPLLLGVINRTKAFFAGRRGPPLFQAYFDIAKLLCKGSVFSRTTTWIFRAGPVAGVVTAIAASMLIPFGAFAAPIAFDGDLILLAYLLGLGRFFTVLAALDTGSAFEGMGGAREATFACLAEPALLLGLMVLATGAESLSLSAMLGSGLGGEWRGAAPSLALIAVSMFIVLLAENSRIPFDDPNTHLELTMVHEVMVLDHSGPAFGLILYGASVKLFVFAALIVRVALPFELGGAALDALLFFAGTIALAIAVGVVESVMARLRMIHVPNLLVAACILSSLGIVLLVR